ncbi:hypothetical protein RYX36_016760 [Vicia faba]
MERWEKKPVKMSVPQFGGWENKPKGVPTDYSMVFNQARENKKNHKIDLTEVRRLSGTSPVLIDGNLTKKGFETSRFYGPFIFRLVIEELNMS